MIVLSSSWAWSILTMFSYPSIFTRAGMPPDLKMASKPSRWWERLCKVPAVQRAVSTSFVFCMVRTIADTIWGERMMACLEASFLESWWTITAALLTTTYNIHELRNISFQFSNTEVKVDILRLLPWEFPSKQIKKLAMSLLTWHTHTHTHTHAQPPWEMKRKYKPREKQTPHLNTLHRVRYLLVSSDLLQSSFWNLVAKWFRFVLLSDFACPDVCPLFKNFSPFAIESQGSRLSPLPL